MWQTTTRIGPLLTMHEVTVSWEERSYISAELDMYCAIMAGHTYVQCPHGTACAKWKTMNGKRGCSRGRSWNFISDMDGI